MLPPGLGKATGVAFVVIFGTIKDDRPVISPGLGKAIDELLVLVGILLGSNGRVIVAAPVVFVALSVPVTSIVPSLETSAVVVTSAVVSTSSVVVTSAVVVTLAVVVTSAVVVTVSEVVVDTSIPLLVGSG